MLRKSMSLFGAALVLTLVLAVGYGIYTSCDNVAIYVYCDKSER